jgi:hypothetical protein
MADNIERACGFAGPRFPRARRIVAQLVENTGGTSTAAPPASDAAIHALPKKKVNEEGQPCMDAVEMKPMRAW